MSYARFGSDSDVYVYCDIGGYLCCCACRLASEPCGSREFFTTADMLAHLDEHRAAGHAIPDYTRPALEGEADENDSWIASQGEGSGDGD